MDGRCKMLVSVGVGLITVLSAYKLISYYWQPGNKHEDECECSEHYLEMRKLKCFHPLVEGKLDAATFTDNDETFPVIVHYSESVDPSQLCGALGVAELDDGSHGVVYRGEAMYMFNDGSERETEEVKKVLLLFLDKVKSLNQANMTLSLASDYFLIVCADERIQVIGDLIPFDGKLDTATFSRVANLAFDFDAKVQSTSGRIDYDSIRKILE